MYDYLIIGSGLFGSICAYELNKKNKKCLVIEKRKHIGGNCYTENKEGINIHKYGPHIFHTSNEKIWKYINQFAKFNNFINRPKVKYKNLIYSFPINLFTISQIYGISTPEEAQKKLNEVSIKNENPKNLEEWILSQVGYEIYEKFIKGYTTKQWGRNPIDLPISIIKRLPIRFNYDDNYFNDIYQGIPVGGYTQIFHKLLDGIEVKLNHDYLKDKNSFNKLAKKIIYTGPLDAFYDYRFGKLDYRSLKFKTEKFQTSDFQGNAIINYTEAEIPYTRIVEHKHFEHKNTNITYITKEYPSNYCDNSEPYYPINDEKNNKIYKMYKEISNKEKKVIFGGRLAEYKYYDMHQIIGSAINASSKEIKNFNY